MSKHNQQQDYTATLESTTPETLTLKDRFAIAKIISKAPKSRVLMISKVFEPVLGTDLTPYYDERSLQDSVLLQQNEAVEATLDFIDSYDEAVIKEFPDGARALNNNLFKEYLTERKMNFNNVSRLLGEAGIIRRETNGRRSFAVYHNGNHVRALIINPDIVIKEN